METFPKHKKCEFCNFNSFFSLVNSTSLSCPFCENHKCIKFYTQYENHYCYCNQCQIIFKYNENQIHHQLYDDGNIYYTEIISKYVFRNCVFSYCPIFKDFDETRQKEFIRLFEMNIIQLEFTIHKKEDICCVCYETTCHHTECNHFVCEKCIQSLTLCPICRYSFTIVNKMKNLSNDIDIDNLSNDIDIDNDTFNLNETTHDWGLNPTNHQNIGTIINYARHNWGTNPTVNRRLSSNLNYEDYIID